MANAANWKLNDDSLCSNLGDGITVLTVYGHSWAFGTGASLKENGFASLVSKSVGLRLDNRAVSGCCTTDVLLDVIHVPPSNTGFYVVCSGLNDLRRYGVAPKRPEIFRLSIESILERIDRAAPGSPIVLIEQAHLLDYRGFPPYDKGSHGAVDIYNEQLRSAARNAPSAVMTRLPQWSPETMLADDGVHPNDRGHAYVAECVTAEIRRHRRTSLSA